MSNLNNNNNNNNKDTLNNKQVGTNNVRTYLKYLPSENYTTILYLLLTKNYTYKSELNVLLRECNWNHYFQRLSKDGIIKPYKLTGDEDSYLVHRNGTGRTQLGKAIFYTLTDEAKETIEGSMIYDLVVRHVTEDLINYVLDYKAKVTVHNQRYITKEEIVYDLTADEYLGFEE